MRILSPKRSGPTSRPESTCPKPMPPRGARETAEAILAGMFEVLAGETTGTVKSDFYAR